MNMRSLIFILALILLAVVGLTWQVGSGSAGDRHHWPIRWLEIDGDIRRTSNGQIQGAVQRQAERGFFAADLDQVREDLEALPWIARASVRRQWPDSLRVTVIEHRPVARWNENGLVSDRGELFHANGSTGMQGLPRLAGPDSRFEQVIEHWAAMHAMLASAGLGIDALELDSRGAWSLHLSNGTVVELGREQVLERVERLVRVSRALAEQARQPRVIDMRYSNGLAVRWVAASEDRESDHG